MFFFLLVSHVAHYLLAISSTSMVRLICRSNYSATIMWTRQYNCNQHALITLHPDIDIATITCATPFDTYMSAAFMCWSPKHLGVNFSGVWDLRDLSITRWLPWFNGSTLKTCAYFPQYYLALQIGFDGKRKYVQYVSNFSLHQPHVDITACIGWRSLSALLP